MDDFDLFQSIAAENKELEKSGDYRDYKVYINTLLDQLQSREEFVTQNISSPTPNAYGEYVCIKEPIEFIKLFEKYSNSKDECQRLFTNLLENRDPAVVEQVIHDNDSDRVMWFNSTEKYINLRPGLRNNETRSPEVVQFGKPDDNVHALVVGSTGSGKSVFLHNLLFSMMAEYAPWELNFFLIDFKKVTLSKYLSNCETPHVKAVAATSEVRYVVSLLNHLNDCMRTRQTFFSYLGIEKLSELRSKYQIMLPRCILLVDEFQQMFLEATSREEREINDILTSITKLGRATGFHLIFASQEMTGTLGASVFANFKVRFALRCTADISSSFLGNPEASTITDREKGVVYENSKDGKANNNRRFQVPFINEEENYFSDFLKDQTDMADRVSYRSVHKYYQEDFISNYSELVALQKNNNLIDYKRKVLNDYPNIVDILTLGDAVVFNYKKIDCETVFLEYGSKKNIGIFSPRLKDVVYVSKLLSTNFSLSPNSEKCEHWALIRNALFERSFDLKSALNIRDERYFHTDDKFELYFVDEVLYRKDVVDLIQGYEGDETIAEVASKAYLLFMKYYFGDEGVKALEDGVDIDGYPSLEEYSGYFADNLIENIPANISNLIAHYEDMLEKATEVLSLFYEYKCAGKELSKLFKLIYIWVVGTDIMNTVSSYGSNALAIEEASNYQVVFIFAGTSDARNFELFDTCDYLFLAGNQERIYDRWGIPYTNKTEDSKVIDFKVKSANIVRSFKKYYSDDDVSDLPRIDFDELLGANI